MTRSANATHLCHEVQAAALACIIAVTVIGCGSKARVDKEAQRPVLSVCELVGKLSAYRGHMVVVRGVYYQGALRQDDCPQPFVTKTHRWPTAINVMDSRLAADLGSEVPFITDEKSWDNVERACIKQGERGSPAEIWATIEGQLRARENYVLAGPTDGVVLGYGHLGVFPAEIVIKRVFDVEVKPTPESRYDYRARRKSTAQ